jgi:hypothetical protein
MNTKTVFQIDRAGMYLGVTEADESPLEPGVFLMPARTVEAAPPDSWPDDQCPRWNGVEWLLVSKPTADAAKAEAADKLRAFLAANPEVAELVGI